MGSTKDLKEVIAAWLDLTEEDVPLAGLDTEEAFRRAADLRARLRAGETVRPPAVLDEDFKDTLCALVRLLSDSPAEIPQKRAVEARAVHRFIAPVVWEPDEFGEKEELLKECEALVLENDPDPAAASRAFAPDSEPTSIPPASSKEVANAVFRDARPVLHLLLLRRYGLTEAQAEALEQKLHEWFLRFHRRSDGQDQRSLQALLFRACAEFAIDYASTDGIDLARQDSLPPSARLSSVRSRPPRRVEGSPRRIRPPKQS